MNQLIHGIRLFTGVDEHVIEDGIVWVSGDRIDSLARLTIAQRFPSDIREAYIQGPICDAWNDRDHMPICRLPTPTLLPLVKPVSRPVRSLPSAMLV